MKKPEPRRLARAAALLCAPTPARAPTPQTYWLDGYELAGSTATSLK